jgi:IS5 family transposase
VDLCVGLEDEQLTLAAVGFERSAKTTQRAAFLAKMERVVPWSALCVLRAPRAPLRRPHGGEASSPGLLPAGRGRPDHPVPGSHCRAADRATTGAEIDASIRSTRTGGRPLPGSG